MVKTFTPTSRRMAFSLATASAELEHKPASAAVKWAWERYGAGVVLAASFQDCVLIDIAAQALQREL